MTFLTSFTAKATVLLSDLSSRMNEGYLDAYTVENKVTSVRNALIGIVIGIFIGTLAAAFSRLVMGIFVRALLEDECLSPERAKTLDELGVKGNFLIRLGLRRGYYYRSTVRSIEQDEFLARIKEEASLENISAADSENGLTGLPTEGSTDDVKGRKKKSADKKANTSVSVFCGDVNSMHFYIPEEKRYTAGTRFGKKGSELMGIILTVAVCALLLLLIVNYSEDIIRSVLSTVYGVSAE